MTTARARQRPDILPAQAAAADQGVSVAVVLYLTAIAIPIHFNVASIYMTGVRTLLLVMIVPLTLQLFSGRFGRLLPTDILLPVYGFWSVFTLYLNSPTQAISFGGSYVLEVYGSYLLARAFIRTPRQFRGACRSLFAVLMFTLPFAIYETQTGWAPLPQLVSKLPGLFSYADYANSESGRRLGLERSQVVFAHPIHYGVFSASLFSLAFVGLRNRVSGASRYLVAGLACLGVLCSVSSGAILPMFFQVGLIAWAWAFQRVKRRWIILTILATICYVVVDSLSNRTPITVLLEYVALSSETAYGRIIIFEWGMVNVWKHPILGLGLNDWERPWYKFSGSMDNFWLLSTVRYGIPGFLLLVAAYGVVFFKAMFHDLGTSGEAWQYRRAWVFTQVALIMALCTVDVWSTALSFIFFVLGMGAWFSHYRNGEDDAMPVTPSSLERRGADDGDLGTYTRFSNRRQRG